MKDLESADDESPGPPRPAGDATSPDSLKAAEADFLSQLSDYRRHAINWTSGGGLLGGAATGAALLNGRHIHARKVEQFAASVKQLFEIHPDRSFAELQDRIEGFGHRALGLARGALPSVMEASVACHEALRTGNGVETGMAHLRDVASMASRRGLQHGLIAPALAVTGASIACAVVGTQLYHLSHQGAARECGSKRKRFEQLLNAAPASHSERLEAQRAEEATPQLA